MLKLCYLFRILLAISSIVNALTFTTNRIPSMFSISNNSETVQTFFKSALRTSFSRPLFDWQHFNFWS